MQPINNDRVTQRYASFQTQQKGYRRWDIWSCHEQESTRSTTLGWKSILLPRTRRYHKGIFNLCTTWQGVTVRPVGRYLHEDRHRSFLLTRHAYVAESAGNRCRRKWCIRWTYEAIQVTSWIIKRTTYEVTCTTHHRRGVHNATRTLWTCRHHPQWLFLSLARLERQLSPILSRLDCRVFRWILAATSSCALSKNLSATRWKHKSDIGTFAWWGGVALIVIGRCNGPANKTAHKSNCRYRVCSPSHGHIKESVSRKFSSSTQVNWKGILSVQVSGAMGDDREQARRRLGSHTGVPSQQSLKPTKRQGARDVPGSSSQVPIKQRNSTRPTEVCTRTKAAGKTCSSQRQHYRTDQPWARIQMHSNWSVSTITQAQDWSAVDGRTKYASSWFVLRSDFRAQEFQAACAAFSHGSSRWNAPEDIPAPSHWPPVRHQGFQNHNVAIPSAHCL